MWAAGSHEMTRDPGSQLDDLRDRPRREHHVVVRELDALRLAGRARGVDQRQHVVWRHPRRGGRATSKPGLLSLHVAPARAFRRAASPSTTITFSSAGQLGGASQHHIQEGRLDERHLAPGPAADTRPPRPGVGRVDRERRRAEHRRGQIDDMELGPVANMIATVSPRATPRPARPAASASTRAQQLRPAQRDAVVRRSHGDDRPGARPRSAAVLRSASPASTARGLAIAVVLLSMLSSTWSCLTRSGSRRGSTGADNAIAARQRCSIAGPGPSVYWPRPVSCP